MPRTNSQRQKNKPFKSHSKGATDRKKNKASTKTKSITKQKGRVKNTRSKLLHDIKEKKEAEIKKITAKNESLSKNSKQIILEQLKNQSQIKIIVLFPGNKEANTHSLIGDIYKSLEGTAGLTFKTNFQGIPYPVLQILPSGKSFIKHKLMIISGQRTNQELGCSLQSLMDLVKCADIICPVLSCKSTNVKEMHLDPHEKGGAFDERGYIILNMIRSLGAPSTIGIVQHLQHHQLKNHDKIERLFKRFISSELGQNDKINYLKGNQHELNKLIRQMDTTTPIEQSWKKDRGYMMVEDITTDPESQYLTFHGYLKGNCIHQNQLVHVTGFDDYQIFKIEIKPNKSIRKPNQSQMQANQMEGNTTLQQHSRTPESLFPFSKVQQISDDILSGLNNLRVSQNKQKNQMGEEENDGYIDEQSGDEQEEEDIEEYFQNNKQEEKIKRIQMKMREEDELEFEDQVEYGADEILREKFKDYQGLKNFKTSQWNELQNLPDEYDRIYTFKHYARIHQNVLAQQEAKAFAYPNFYISVTIKNFPKEKILQYSTQYPIILTFLLKHERKMTQLHAKVRRNPHYPSNDTFVESNQLFSISIGFRRDILRPIYSRVIPGSEKTKYAKKIGEDYESYFYCSFYYYNYFPPAPVQIYRVISPNTNEIEASPIMYGTLAKCDPLHVILERIILTGYPFKINKRRSTVRFMFFNPKDVKYFKPVEVRTKMGLKGRIEQSLGTHGYMKVLFNDKIKHNDTVCMYLYRRVYPEPNF